MRRLAAELASAESPVDLLVHCAGALENGLKSDFSIAQLDTLYRLIDIALAKIETIIFDIRLII